MIYQENTRTFPPPKITYKHDLNWTLVWKRLKSDVHDSTAKDILFRIIHNILPNRQRLFRMNKCADPFCENEAVWREVEGPLNESVSNRSNMKIVVGGEIEDNLHLFSSCGKTRESWLWLRRIVLEFLPPNSESLSNWEIIHLAFPQYLYENSILWLISSYCEIVWTDSVKRRQNLDSRKVISALKNRYMLHQMSNRKQLTPIDFSFA